MTYNVTIQAEGEHYIDLEDDKKAMRFIRVDDDKFTQRSTLVNQSGLMAALNDENKQYFHLVMDPVYDGIS